MSSVRFQSSTAVQPRYRLCHFFRQEERVAFGACEQTGIDMDWVRVLRELRLGLAELSGIKAAAFLFIVASFIFLFAGRGLWMLMSVLLSIH